MGIATIRPEGLPGIEVQRGAHVAGDVPRHWHEEYHLCAITGGYGELCHRGTTHRNPAGTLNLVEPGEVHSNQTRNARGCDFLKLDFDPALFAMAAREAAPPRDTHAFSVPTISDAVTFQRFVRLCYTLIEPADPLLRQQCFLEFLILLRRRHTRSRGPIESVGREPRAVSLVREHLTANYARKVELTELTTLTGLSPFHLTRVFARETGLPPHAFLNQVRIQHAKALLRSRVPISRVAQETGFADQSHLTRTFKQIVRVSPGAYRATGR